MRGKDLGDAARAGAKSMMNQVQDKNADADRSVAAAQLGNTVQVASSQRDAPKPVKLNDGLQKQINTLKDQNKFKDKDTFVPGENGGVHAEINAINNYMAQNNDKPPPPEGNVRVVDANGNGKGVCKSCQVVLDSYKIRARKRALFRRMAESIQASGLAELQRRTLDVDHGTYAPQFFIRSRL